MELRSPAFAESTPIPAPHTCDGEDISPPLEWAEVPAGTASLALIVDDPDAPDPAAPKMTWVHWVVYNLPPQTTGLAAGVKNLPAGALEGVNDFGRAGFGGPCPPKGRHRYVFKLYALSQRLPAIERATKAQVERAMRGHLLAEARLVGTYERGRR